MYIITIVIIIKTDYLLHFEGQITHFVVRVKRAWLFPCGETWFFPGDQTAVGAPPAAPSPVSTITPTSSIKTCLEEGEIAQQKVRASCTPN